LGRTKIFFGVVSYQVPNWMLRSYGSVIDRGWTNGDLGRESKSAPRICAKELNDIMQKEYSIGLERIRNSLTLPAQKWTASQIMIRILWTAVKESRTRRGTAGNKDWDV